jgi:murein DD-endopeptidase MepM/ murein hydrolase activator NlpD
VSKAALPLISADPGVVRVVQAQVRRVVIAIGMMGLLGTAPGSLLATLSTDPPRPAAVELQNLRERTVRRQAMARQLAEQVETLAAEIAAQKAARQEYETDYSAARQQLAGLERELDYLVPRLLAREALVEARRDQASRALARLANVSREVDIAPEVRARLLAVSPMMLDRLYGAEASAAQLRQEAEQQSVSYHRLLDRAPALLEARQRAERLREQAARRKQAVEDRLAGLHAEIAGLVAEQQRIARKLMARESAELARAEPQADEPTAGATGPQTAPDQLPEAVVRGELAEPLPVAEALGAGAVTGRPKGVVAGRPEPALSANADVGRLIGPPPAKPGGIQAPAAASVTAGLAQAESRPLDAAPTAPSRLAALVTAARLDVQDPPVLPVPGDVVLGGHPRLVPGEHDPSLVIEAEAGQAVAAPERGRVVFAGRFKRYGLLLMIEHSADYHTLLWGFAELRVQRGDQVRAGQVVGVLGTPKGGPASLHMEVRRNGEPVNPLLWMAATSSKVQG